MTARASSTRWTLRDACPLALACACMLAYCVPAAADTAGKAAFDIAARTAGAPPPPPTGGSVYSGGTTLPDWAPRGGVQPGNVSDAPWRTPMQDTTRRGGVYPDVPLVPCDAIGEPDEQGRTFSCYSNQSVPDRPNAAAAGHIGKRTDRPGALTRLRRYAH